MSLPPRTADTLSEAIALSSPSGRISRRTREAASARLARALFGDAPIWPVLPPQPTKRERLLRQAAELRALAARGMSVRVFTKQAAALEIEAELLQ